MADLSTLIRLRKHHVDQKQKFLAELYRQAEALDEQKETLKKQLEEENARAKDYDAEFLAFMGAYSKAVQQRIKDIEEDRKKLEERIETAREVLREAFAEMKKIEIIDENRKEEEKKILAKKDSNTLDEVAIDGFRRKQEQEEND